jgi:hypothetical protein
MNWLLILAAFVAWLTATIATLRFRLAIFDEVEADTPLSHRRSWQIRLEPKGAMEQQLLLEHRRRFPFSRLRRNFYVARSLAVTLFFGVLAAAWYCLERVSVINGR